MRCRISAFQGIAATKQALRRTKLGDRRLLSTDERTRADAAICEVVATLVAGRTAAGYVPLVGEPGGSALLPALNRADRLLLPILRHDRDLDWAPYTGSLIRGERGISQPSGPGLGVDAIAAAAVVIVPAVAVDRRGARLGRGGGSYDRALARAKGQVIALVYDAEVVDVVPSESHDRPVDLVITPRGPFRPRSTT